MNLGSARFFELRLLNSARRLLLCALESLQLRHGDGVFGITHRCVLLDPVEVGRGFVFVSLQHLVQTEVTVNIGPLVVI